MKRITIAGGGLAGLSLGIALRRRGVPVELHEAGAYPRHRVCGEFINGVGAKTLEELGVAGLLADALCLRSTTWFRGAGSIYRAELPVPALGISRFVLDARLADAFRDGGGELHERSRMKPSAGRGLVWAAGRRADGTAPWLGLKLHSRGLSCAADLEMHIGRGAYLGLAKVGGGTCNVCGLFKRRSVEGKGVDLMFRYLEVCGLGELARRLRGAEVDAGSFLGVAGFRFGRQRRAEGGLCVLGDSDRMIPPFTGNGMSMAFESAAAALGPLCEYSSGRIGWRAAVEAIDRSLASRFRRRLAVARALHPLLLSRGGGALLSLAARGRLLPFNSLFRSLR